MRQGNIKIAFEVADKTDDPSTYTELALLLFEQYNFEVALGMIDFHKQLEPEFRESICEEIAFRCFQQDNHKKAIEIVDHHIISLKLRESTYKEFALSCCQEAKYRDSMKFISKIGDAGKIMGDVFLTVANEHYRKGDFEKALKTIDFANKVPLGGIGAESLRLEIKRVKDYIEQGKLDKAAEVHL